MFRKSRGEASHAPLHLILVVMVLVTLYPLLWVVSIAFSGQQSLSIANVPENASTWDRLRQVNTGDKPVLLRIHAELLPQLGARS